MGIKKGLTMKAKNAKLPIVVLQVRPKIANDLALKSLMKGSHAKSATPEASKHLHFYEEYTVSHDMLNEAYGEYCKMFKTANEAAHHAAINPGSIITRMVNYNANTDFNPVYSFGEAGKTIVKYELKPGATPKTIGYLVTLPKSWERLSA